jgi:signal transduction histidine kinase
VVKNVMEAIGKKGLVSFETDRALRQLVIADSGAGIPESVAGELFSPFFSTKRDGQGIGLTLVKEVLLKHGYPFSLKTVAPGRTEFTIWFGEGGVVN